LPKVEKKKSWLSDRHISRDSMLFAGGLLGVLHETVLTNVERPSLLVVFGGMMGLPAFLRADEKRKADKE
jgi:hypothetical protein